MEFLTDYYRTLFQARAPRPWSLSLQGGGVEPRTDSCEAQHGRGPTHPIYRDRDSGGGFGHRWVKMPKGGWDV